jgi:AraC-like DNA-binding protein
MTKSMKIGFFLMGVILHGFSLSAQSVGELFRHLPRKESFSVTVFTQPTNPFLAMVGKAYPDFCFDLREIYYRIEVADSATLNRAIRDMEEAAQIANRTYWMLEAEFCSIYSFHKYPKNRQIDFQLVVDDLNALAEKAEKQDIQAIRFRALHTIARLYSHRINNYELAFEYYARLIKLIEPISVEELPDKIFFYSDIGNLYLSFGDFDKASVFFNKMIEYPAVANGFFQLERAYNGLAHIYRDHYNDLDSADYYLERILENSKHVPDPWKLHRNLWLAIGTGNMGTNLYLKKNYSEAIPLLREALEIMINNDDFDYASLMAIRLTNCYLETGNLSDARKYMEKAEKYINIWRATTDYDSSYAADLYPLKSKYYAATGNPKLSILYTDSSEIKRREYNKEFNAIKLLRAEQRTHILEQEIKENTIREVKLQNEQRRKDSLIMLTAFILTICTLAVLYFFYRKKQQAYRDLVRKNQQWVESLWTETPKPFNPNTDEIPVCANPEEETSSPYDEKLMERIHNLMNDSKRYKDPDLTLDLIADELQVNRNHISATVNRGTGKNLKTYLNEYRVKEAINLLSKKESDKYSLDGIAVESGFNDRHTFSRAFKNITGLSPATFRKNLQERKGKIHRSKQEE